MLHENILRIIRSVRILVHAGLARLAHNYIKKKKKTLQLLVCRLLCHFNIVVVISATVVLNWCLEQVLLIIVTFCYAAEWGLTEKWGWVIKINRFNQ